MQTIGHINERLGTCGKVRINQPFGSGRNRATGTLIGTDRTQKHPLSDGFVDEGSFWWGSVESYAANNRTGHRRHKTVRLRPDLVDRVAPESRLAWKNLTSAVSTVIGNA
jgi:hypothetical protein